jgi:hypothetical protein
MIPTRNQIERAAYDRWLRRDRAHGHDRYDWISAENELTFILNYRTIVEYGLDSREPTILGNDRARRCRLCERTSRHATFSTARPVIQGGGETSLLSAEICDECQIDCRDPLAGQCQDLWEALKSGPHALPQIPHHIDSIAVLKSLVTSALLIMPEHELGYFGDTIEWVNNPDHEYDGGLFAGTCCRVYQAPFLYDRSWTSLERRIDDEAAFPYMLSFIAWEGIILQVSVPMCACDEDLDGRGAWMPQRALAAGEGPHFRESHSTQLRFGAPGSRPKAGGRRAVLHESPKVA